MTAIIVDTETTDVEQPVPVEVAYWRVDNQWPLCLVGDVFSERFNPGKPISFGAMGIHHITDDDVKDCKPFSDFQLPTDALFIIGHNVDFDWRALGEPKVKRICTLALSRWLWPASGSHTLTAMMYQLNMPYARMMAMHAHGAGADVEMCAALLDIILKHEKMAGVSSIQQLWEHSEVARIPTVMTFGKHKGTPIAQVPSDYKRWLLNQPDVDPYLAKALKS